MLWPQTNTSGSIVLYTQDGTAQTLSPDPFWEFQGHPQIFFKLSIATDEAIIQHEAMQLQNCLCHCKTKRKMLAEAPASEYVLLLAL